MHFDVVLSVLIHPCTKKRKRPQFSIRAELTQLDVCAENFSHSARLLRQQSQASFMLALCLRAVLISSPVTWDWMRMHTLALMHRRTLCENVDSAKIKVPFILQILIFYAWHWCIVMSYILSIYQWIVSPLQFRGVRYDNIYRMDKIKSLSFHNMFYNLFCGVAKYIVYGNTVSSFEWLRSLYRSRWRTTSQDKTRSSFLNKGLHL